MIQVKHFLFFISSKYDLFTCLLADSVESNTKPEKVDYSISENNSTYSFIRQLCLDVGVILKPEEISPNILLNTAEIVLQQAIKCLAENIIRDSRAVLVLEGNFRYCYINYINCFKIT